MDGCAARVTARVSDDERVKPLDASLMRSKTVNTIWFLVCVYSVAWTCIYSARCNRGAR